MKSPCDSCGIVLEHREMQTLPGTQHRFCRHCAESCQGFAQVRANAGRTEAQIIQEITLRYPKRGVALVQSGSGPRAFKTCNKGTT
jgi:predicted sulfurtransferase